MNNKQFQLKCRILQSMELLMEECRKELKLSTENKLNLLVSLEDIHNNITSKIYTLRQEFKGK